MRPRSPPRADGRPSARAAVIFAAIAVLALGVPATMGAGGSGDRSPLALPPTGDLIPGPPGTPGSAGSAPTVPPVEICGNASELTGPATPPAGAVTIPAGNDSDLTASYQLAPNTTYWLAPGVHTLGGGPYAQFQPDGGDTFVGAPGAVIDGQGENQFAFTANPNVGAPNVTVEYLTIVNFTSGEGEGVVNQADQPGWQIVHDTVGPNEFNGSDPGGAGVMLGTDDAAEFDCLAHNGEYGFSSFGGSTQITLSDDEIAYNDAYGGYDQPGSAIQCGCSGGGKFWISTDVSVTDDYVHDNGGVGIWVDTDNAGVEIAHNYIADNYDEGIVYEISYNGLIENNTLVGNAVASGPQLGGFPDSAVYISESGFDARVANPFDASAFLVEDNVLTNNWGGVVIWENANRYCSDGSDQVCTLVDPAVFTLTSCAAHLGERSPVDYYDGCRWKAQNVTVEGNRFSFSPAAVGADCTAANYCGENGLFSDYGEPPYAGPAVPTNITFDQNNHFRDNQYVGPWGFEAWSQGNLDNPVNWTVWRANVTDACETAGDNQSGTCDSGFAQDSGSTLGAASAPFVASFAASPSTIPLGGSSYLNVSAEGGVGTLGYAYSGLPPGCASADTADLLCRPTAPGAYSVTVYVNDSVGGSANASASLGVEGAPASSAPAPDSDLWIYLGGGAAAVAVAGTVLALRRRRAGPPTS